MRLCNLVLLIIFVASHVAGTCAYASSSPQSVPASEIILKLAEGQPALYDSETIVGDLNLSNLPEARITNKLQLINCTVSNANFDGIDMEKETIFWGTTFKNSSFSKARFLGPSDFSDTSFEKTSFDGSTFSQPVIFDGAFFLSPVSFMDSRFEKDASFNGVRFDDVDFNYSTFGYYSYFSGAQFLGNATFTDVNFLGAADFSSSFFGSQANFMRSRFEEAATFSDAVFRGPAQFGLTKFQGISSFGNSSFGGEAGFALARFADAAYFSGSHFHDLALFGLTKFEDIASFQEAAFEGDLILKGGSISTMLLEKAEYGQGSRIILNDTDFNRLRSHWNEINAHVVYDPGTFLALIDNYRGLGWSRDQDDCYYQYRRMSLGEKGWGWSKLIDVLAWLSCGYGVRPDYAVAWSILTILIFAVVFLKGDGIRRSAKPLHESAEVDTLPEHVNFKNALFFSTMVFLSQGPIDFLPVGRHRYYVILEGILGWLLLALFLVTLGKVMIR